MAQRRMIHAKILENVEFGTLSPKARLLYLFSIVLADDEGRLKANAVSLRGRVFAFDQNITPDDVRKYLNEIVKKRLVTWYKVENEHFIQHPNWLKYQTLRTDRKKDSVIPPPDGNQMATKRGRSKEVSKKGREVTASLEYLKKIPDEDMDQFHKKFDASKKAIASKAEDLFLWCESNGRVKKNYKAFLLNALKKDFPERQNAPKIAVVPQERSLSMEEIERSKGVVQSIGDVLRKNGVLPQKV